MNSNEYIREVLTELSGLLESTVNSAAADVKYATLNNEQIGIAHIVFGNKSATNTASGKT